MIDRTCTFRTRISDFNDSSYELLSSSIEIASPALPMKEIMSESIRLSNAWRTHNITSKEGEESPSMETLTAMHPDILKNNQKLVRVYWTTDGDRCMNLQFEFNDGSLCPPNGYYPELAGDAI